MLVQSQACVCYKTVWTGGDYTTALFSWYTAWAAEMTSSSGTFHTFSSDLSAVPLQIQINIVLPASYVLLLLIIRDILPREAECPCIVD